MESIIRRTIPVLLFCGWTMIASGQGTTGQENVTETLGIETNEIVDTDQDAYDQIKLLTEALLHIRKHYVDEKSYQEITYGAIHGMLEALDPYSAFLEEEAYEILQDETTGKFSGIGIRIGMIEGIPTIISPIEDTPAFRAGVQPGDRIIKIDGEETLGKPLREAVKKLRGPEGAEVVLTLERKGEEGFQEIGVTRAVIEVPSVKGARIIRRGIGYIRITQFQVPTAELLQKALDDLFDRGMTALVLDLRANPGGLLRSAVEVAQEFLKKGQVIVTTRGRKGVVDPTDEKAGGDHHYMDFPVAVLVNHGTASAAEIVAGALQDHGRAIIVGTRTFGKASVQSVIPLPSDRDLAIRLTTARYYTPKGRAIHETGISPDIVVEISPSAWRNVLVRRAQEENPEGFSEEDKAAYKDVVDEQLQRAVDILDGVLILSKK